MEKRLGLTVPLDEFTLAEHAELVREAERIGYRDAWSFEADGVDAFAPLAVAGEASGLRLGTAIVNVYTRGPATLAMSAAGLAEIAPGRFILGIGSGSDVIVEAWNGGAFRKPLTRVWEMTQFLRRALAGERVVFRGETFAVDGFRLSRPLTAPVPIYVAALRADVGSVEPRRSSRRRRRGAQGRDRRPPAPRSNPEDSRGHPTLPGRWRRHRVHPAPVERT